MAQLSEKVNHFDGVQKAYLLMNQLITKNQYVKYRYFNQDYDRQTFLE